jgi:ribosome biogenesis GTPase
MITGLVQKSTGKWYDVLLASGESVQARLRGRSKQFKSQFTNPVAVGDEVEIDILSEQDYLISNILPRKNYITRKATKAGKQVQVLAANVDQALAIISRKSPHTSLYFLDKFLVQCNAYDIPVQIAVNKTDILTSENDISDLKKVVGLYKGLGYEVYQTSFSQNKCPKALLVSLEGRTTYLFGHSGVGKSTFINFITQGKEQEVKSVSSYHQQGKHTTTFSRMITLPGKEGRIIDSPGVREFEPAGIESSELSHYFVEMNELRQSCKYRNCLHMEESACQVRKMMQNDSILSTRYQSYVRLMSELGPD